MMDLDLGLVANAQLDPDNLYDGNLHPPEYYRDTMPGLAITDFQRKEYADGTERLIANAENQFRRYASSVRPGQQWLTYAGSVPRFSARLTGNKSFDTSTSGWCTSFWNDILASALGRKVTSNDGSNPKDR